MGLLDQAQAAGRYGDTILAHINPEEAALLKSLGGSGTINPTTGLPEFYGGMGNDSASDISGGFSDAYGGDPTAPGNSMGPSGGDNDSQYSNAFTQSDQQALENNAVNQGNLEVNSGNDAIDTNMNMFGISRTDMPLSFLGLTPQQLTNQNTMGKGYGLGFNAGAFLGDLTGIPGAGFVGSKLASTTPLTGPDIPGSPSTQTESDPFATGDNGNDNYGRSPYYQAPIASTADKAVEEVAPPVATEHQSYWQPKTLLDEQPNPTNSYGYAAPSVNDYLGAFNQNNNQWRGWG